MGRNNQGRVSHLEDIQKLPGHSPGQPALGGPV